MLTLIDTTFSGKNLTNTVSVYEYTVAAAGTFRFQLRLASVAGAGDYTVNLRLNDGDAQSDDVVAPKTTYTAAAGETAFWFTTISVDALAGDVINVMVKGLAGDTSRGGSIRIFTENYSTHSVADVWAALTSALTTAGSIGKLLVDRIDAAITSRMATFTYTAPPTVGQIDTQLSTTHGATPWGTAGVTVEAYVAVSAADALAVSAGSFGLTTYYTFIQSVDSTTTSDLSAATKVWLAIKESQADADDASLIFCEKTAGLTYVAKAAHATTADGSITVSGSSGDWHILLHVEEAATSLLDRWQGTWTSEIKALVGGDTISVWSGNCKISGGIARAY